LRQDAPPALASCEFEPPAVLLVVNLSFVMRSSSCSRLPLKYPPRQAEYFYGYSETKLKLTSHKT
jgi:hypothetical protein